MEAENAKKKCSKCKKMLTLDNFKPDRQLCIKYLEGKARYRENHREEINQKANERYYRNREEHLQKRKDYVKENPEKVLQQKKEYRERKKEPIREYAKEYYEEHKEEIFEKQKVYQQRTVECPVCKCQVRKYKMKTHEESRKHQNSLLNQLD